MNLAFNLGRGLRIIADNHFIYYIQHEFQRIEHEFSYDITEVSHSFLSRIWEPEVGGQRELKIDVRSESQSQLKKMIIRIYP